METERLNTKPRVRRKKLKRSPRTLGLRKITPASQRLKDLWADPEWRAALLAKRAIPYRKAYEEGRVTRMGVPNGMRKRKALPLIEKAKLRAEKTMAELKDAGVIPATPTTDDEVRAEEALKTSLEIMRGPGDKDTRLRAAALVLKFTKSAPVQKTELTLNKAEAWLKAVAEDNDNGENATDAKASA